MPDRDDLQPDDVYEFLGRRVRVRTNSASVRDRLRLMYARFLLPSAPPADDDAVFEAVDRLEAENLFTIRDGFQECRLAMTGRFPHFSCQDLATGEFRDIGFCDPLTLAQSLLLSTVAERTETHGMFHAGTLALDGRAALLCARSGMGKTTLVLNLILRGCAFLSDEVACVDPATREVLPFLRKINMRRDGMDLLKIPVGSGHTLSGVGDHGPEYAVDPEDIPGVRLAGPSTAAAVIFLRGFADRPLVEPLAPSNALFELVNASLAPVRDAGMALARFAPVVHGAFCCNLICGEPDATADRVLSLLRGEDASHAAAAAS